eukprot:1144916-Pelagomonas_calceolata.AAC.17
MLAAAPSPVQAHHHYQDHLYACEPLILPKLTITLSGSSTHVLAVAPSHVQAFKIIGIRIIVTRTSCCSFPRPPPLFCRLELLYRPMYTL